TQIERVFAAGLNPDHLDTHQHFHLFPRLLSVVITLAKRFDIIRLRKPCPAEPLAMDPGGGFGQELKLYRTLCAQTHLDDACKANLITPDGIWGMPLLNRLDTESLCRLLEGLPEGVWELMTHPGYPFANDGFSGPERAKELVALTSEAARKIIVERKIRLISFEDLPCGF
ncbi:MAG: ChbG/HpnK family deacetylase, partial [Deltaproteobacteria bacterium]|nr:ChbG/HpnK family deacetylase [Deltaproteobacteria bacterium]